MRTLEDKQEFIKLRAEGLSYRQITKETGLAKDTCRRYEKEFREEINQLKADKMQELYKSYHMTKEARIKKLGETLSKINSALDEVDLSTIAPDKLLDYKLKYMEALKSEYTEPSQNRLEGEFDAKDILNSIGDLLNRIQAGTVTPEQASKEMQAYSNLLKAYENVELADKIRMLEGIIGGRN